MAKKSKKGKKSATKKKSIKINVAPATKLLNNFKKSKFYKKVSKQFSKSELKSSLIWALVFIVTLIVMDYAFQYYNNRYTAVVVNGQRISRPEYFAKVEEVAAKNVTDLLIIEELIRQEAKENDVTVDQAEVQEIIDRAIERSGGEEAFNQTLEMQGTTMEDLKKQIELELLATKTATKDLDITDDDLKSFFEQIKGELYPNEDDPKFEDKKDEIKDYYLSYQFQTMQYMWLSSLKAEADIINNVVDKPKFGFLQATINGLEGIYDDLINNDEEDEAETSNEGTDSGEIDADLQQAIQEQLKNQENEEVEDLQDDEADIDDDKSDESSQQDDDETDDDDDKSDESSQQDDDEADDNDDSGDDETDDESDDD